jgi:hypothetical protein
VEQVSVVGPPVDGLTAVEVDDCLTLFNPVTQRAVVLNETASEVWRLSTGEHDADQIIATLAAAYAIPPATIEHEVRGVIADLTAEGLFDASATR